MRQIPIYYINLASRPDRRAFMEEQFDRLGLTAQRIEAVTVADLTSEQVDRYCNPNRRWSMTKSRYACNLSHLRAWGAVEKSGAPRGVILEDDALLSQLLPDFLAALAECSSAPDLIRLEQPFGAGYYREPSETIGGVSLRERVTWDVGAAGYILSSVAASWLCNEPRFHTMLVDWVLFSRFSRIGKKLNARSTDPALCSQIGVQRDGQIGLSSLNETGEDASHKSARKRRPLIKLSRHLEVWLTQDIPQGLQEIIAKRGAERMRMTFNG